MVECARSFYEELIPMTDPFDDDDSDDIVEFHPDPKLGIEKIADYIVGVMQVLNKDADIHFPNFILSVERYCTPAEIVEAYNRTVINFLPDIRSPEPRPRGRDLGFSF